MMLAVAQWLACGAALAGLSAAERADVAEIVRERPRIDLEVSFESRSSKIRIRSGAFHALSALGRALTEPSLRDNVYVVAGHSAVEGRGEAYSQDLSERRADAVKRFLVENFDVRPDTLVAVGYGRSKPKSLDDPYATENQRVQIVNMGNDAAK
ncbi:MAG TPA: OmpA family protein [Bradyrhizobium sp.]|nr:OmpA family protein [Bradyrhizobium sp.]